MTIGNDYWKQETDMDVHGFGHFSHDAPGQLAETRDAYAKRGVQVERILASTGGRKRRRGRDNAMGGGDEEEEEEGGGGDNNRQVDTVLEWPFDATDRQTVPGPLQLS